MSHIDVDTDAGTDADKNTGTGTRHAWHACTRAHKDTHTQICMHTSIHIHTHRYACTQADTQSHAPIQQAQADRHVHALSPSPFLPDGLTLPLRLGLLDCPAFFCRVRGRGVREGEGG